MKLGETSLLEFLCQPLRIFPWVKVYYSDGFRNTALFEHVYTGVIVSLFFAFLMQFSRWLGLGIAVAFLLHVIVKEVILDAKKRVNEIEKKTFWVDLTTRIYGFTLGSPFWIIQLFRP